MALPVHLVHGALVLLTPEIFQVHFTVAGHIEDILRGAEGLLFLNLQLFGLVHVRDGLDRERLVALGIDWLLNLSVLEMLGFDSGDIKALASEHGHVVALKGLVISPQIPTRLLIDIVIGAIRDNFFVSMISPRTIQLICRLLLLGQLLLLRIIIDIILWTRVLFEHIHFVT